MEITRIKKRGLNSEAARLVRQKGYDDALEFALKIGLTSDYTNDAKAKKDVIDPSGDSHSLKGGVKKWQIFLYSLSRFEKDYFFKVMNGMGQLLIDCINAFPQTFDEYQANKSDAKEKLRVPMVAMKEKLQDPDRLRAFISKSMFNGGEVDYLTIKHNDKFHVFWNKEVTDTMADQLQVTNSKSISLGQFPEQKVIFKYKGNNLGELEMRNDSPVHYREIRFNMIKKRILNLLFENILPKKNFTEDVIVYGEAIKHFGRWKDQPSSIVVDN